MTRALADQRESSGSSTNERPFNVLILGSIFHMGGAEKATFDVVRQLNTDEYHVVFCALYEPGPMGTVLMDAGYRLYHGLIRNRFDLRALRRLRRIVAEDNIDAIYLLTQPLTIFWGVIIGKLMGVPIAALVSNTVVIKEHVKLNIYRWFLPLVDRVVAVAHTQKDGLVRETGIASDLVTVIHNGIDLGRFKDHETDTLSRDQMGLAPDTRVVGLVARLVRLKAVDVFVQAARLIADRTNAVEFVVVGSGPELAALVKLSRELDLDRRVHFIGFQKEPAAAIASFDVGVLCSRTEALPIAVLEYMAAGKPVVVTDVGSVRELVTDGENGYIVPPDDPVRLAEKIMCILDGRTLAARMGRAGRERLERHFTLDIMVQRTTDVLDALARKRRSKARREAPAEQTMSVCESSRSTQFQPPLTSETEAMFLNPDEIVITSWTNGSKAVVHLVTNSAGEKFIRKMYRPGFVGNMWRDYFASSYVASRLPIVPKVLAFRPLQRELTFSYLPGERVLEWVLRRFGSHNLSLAEFQSFHGLDPENNLDPRVAAAFENFRGSDSLEARRLKEALRMSYSKLHAIGILHGSADPRNVLYDEERICIIDFDHSRPSLNPASIDYRGLKYWYGLELDQSSRGNLVDR